MGAAILAFFVVLPGIVGIVIFGYHALIDWAALEEAFVQFDTARQQSAALEVLFATATQQDIHRINVFAEGVWVLLSAILAAIGLHGIFAGPRTPRRR